MKYPHNEIERLQKAMTFSTEGYIQVKRSDVLAVIECLKMCQNEESYLAMKELAAHG